MFTEREMDIMKMALQYMIANLDDVLYCFVDFNEFEPYSTDNKMKLADKVIDAPTYEEVEKLLASLS